MAIFTFSAPQYLFFLLAIPLLFFIHFFSLSNKKKKALRFANFDAIARIEGVDFFSKNLIILLINTIVVLALVFSASGLVYHTQAKSSSFSFVLAIDASQSMEANDISPTRIDAAKNSAKDFISNSPLGTKIGIVSFSGSTKIELEPTDRKDEARNAVNSIQIGGIGGADIYEAVLTSANLLRDENSKSIIILSDGQVSIEDNVDQAIDYATKYGVVIHTIGIGTLEGGETQYGISKLDEDTLKSLAYNTNGEYYLANSLENLSSAFNSMYDATERQVALRLEKYLVIFALILLVLEFFLSNTRYVNLP